MPAQALAAERMAERVATNVLSTPKAVQLVRTTADEAMGTAGEGERTATATMVKVTAMAILAVVV
jgi:hypothetical protein